MDLAKRTAQELKNLLANNQRHGKAEMVRSVLEEMERRGIAKKDDYRHLEWKPDAVRKVMQPFRQVAETVPGNERVTYTEAGGLKIGKAKDDPERMWIDTYCGIKKSGINAVFVCYVKRPGDEPEFELRIKNEFSNSFNADELDEALLSWKAIAKRAMS